MSLLNDALRKNKAENSQKIIFDFPFQGNRKSKVKSLVVLILFVVIIGSFIFSWFMETFYYGY